MSGELQTRTIADFGEQWTRYPDRNVALVLEARALAAAGDSAAIDSLAAAHAGRPAATYWSQGALLV